MTKIPHLLIALTAVYASCLGAKVEHSIVSQMDHYEKEESIDTSRFSMEEVEFRKSLLSSAPEKIRAMSWNMLMDIPLINAKLDPKHFWEHRLPRIVEYIGWAEPDLIAVQELMSHQRAQLEEAVKDTYLFVGVGEFDGKEAGQQNGIFYRKGRFECLNQEILWMSPTPEAPSPDPFDKQHTLTLVTLEDRLTGKKFTLGNCHLSFGSADSRAYSVNKIIEKIPTIKGTVLLCGDFNTFPARLDMAGLPFHDGSYLERKFPLVGLLDTKDFAFIGTLGPLSTFTNANSSDITPFKGTGTPGVTLDHIYASVDVMVLIHAVDPARVDGEFPSDHMPVLADVVLIG
ncbi:MAG: endonuclease/exonuclease/phosphatase family protein [Verrucomicrobia bacterium]|nr:endonuclease/exonuclease/phosphatase family protein [Verrucomicrobiota bacterium]